MDTIDQATTVCQDCGQAFLYEPLFIGTHDFGRSLHPRCQTCDEAAAKAEREREEQQRRTAIEAAITATLPPDLVETDIRHPEFNTALWRAMSAWRPSADARWLGIIGRAGRCKTRCMTLYAVRVLRYGLRISWLTAGRLYDIAAEYRHHDDKIRTLAREEFQSALTAPYLFLDDLGKAEWSPAFEARLFQLLDHRKSYKLPVIYSSNVHPRSFEIAISDSNREPLIGRLLDRTTIIEL